MSELSGHMSQLWACSQGAASHSSLADKDDRGALSDSATMSSLLCVADLGTSAGSQLSEEVMPKISAAQRSAGNGGRPSGTELRSRIKYAAREAEKSLHQRQRRAVLSAIQEIPDQVGDALQRSAMGIVDDVIGEVAVVKDMIEGEATSKEAQEQTGINNAVAKLEIIPEMIQDSFEAYFSRAERTVRARVEDMMQNLEASDLANDQVVKTMWAIPSEVQEIAKQAMQAAVVESRVQAQMQIDCALASLPNSGARLLAGAAEERIIPQVPVDSTEMARGAKNAVAGTIDHLLAVVKKDDSELPGVANQVVAETLLRAKVESTDLDLSGNPEKPSLFVSDVNEGSFGHPELCARPCLYFAKGECANGLGCNFCHLEHPRRPVHPDKKNRQILKDMPFSECVAVLAPILKEKVEELGLGSDLLLMLDGFANSLAGPTSGDEESLTDSEPILGGRRKRQLQEFLRSMTLRSVMALLMRAAPTAEQREAVELFTSRMRLASDRRRLL
mmetsp:Transcript_165630/g.402493  ORF Transcript_165630/g.402493 Transcript_165630/m.402493 type:complete len:503 (-) Transcript_165630:127-1635(-)